MAGHNYYLSWSVLLGLLLLWQPSVADAASCKQTGACFFDCGNTVLDLTPLKSAQFNDVIDSSGTSQFSYSPCKRFTEGVGCVKTYVCQVDSFNHSATIDVGSVMTASLNPSGNNYLQYSHKGNDGVKRTTTVTVKCDQSLTANTTLAVHGETKTGSDQYTMTLSSPHACFQRKGSTTPVRPLTTTTENTTTENTTPSSGNVTTPSGNATTENTTPSGNATTENTTPSGNATTENTTPSGNGTTENTTPSSANTTANTNVTTAEVTTTSLNVSTTVIHVTNVTVPGTSHQTLQTTTPSGADVLRCGGERALVMVTMVAAIIMAYL